MYEIFFKASKSELKKIGFQGQNFYFEGRLHIRVCDLDTPPVSYEEEPIAEDQVTLHIYHVKNRFLDWEPALNDILSGMLNMERAQEENDIETLHEQEEILRSNIVIRFLEKICELDSFSIYIFEDDGLIQQRVRYTKDMDILQLVVRAIDYDTHQDIEIYSR